MTSFLVNHGGQAEAHGIMQSAVSEMGSIIDDLNQFLRHMNEAVRVKRGHSGKNNRADGTSTTARCPPDCRSGRLKS
jgi:hypothetical protein